MSTPGRRLPWEPALLGILLVGTAGMYLWALGDSGWANSFYSAAVQAGSVSWKAFFFGSSDAANSITVDKPPASLWLMALSVRAFGLSSWSILVPQALLGVASVALTWATVRRYFGAAAGLLAGLVLALTPVAVLMFRFNNPDALLVFLMIAAVWAMLRAVEEGRTKWLLLCGVFVGFGFLTKQLQVMLVVPPLALTYLIAGPPKLGKRMLQLFAAGGAMIASAGWWIAAVELWPASDRPYIGGSQTNSILELTLGYNGLGRLTGNEKGSVGPGSMGREAFAGGQLPAGFEAFGGPGGRGGGMGWGDTGIWRLFEPAQGGQIAWLMPAALLLLAVGLVLRGRAPRTDPRRAALVLFGSWLVVTALVFSFMAGIFHAYYTVALAPAVAALVGAGGVLAWTHRDRLWVRIALALTVFTSAITSWVLLSRSADFAPWVKWVVVIAGLLAATGLLVPARRTAVAVAIASVVTALAGPTAYAAETVVTPHDGSIVSAGPRVEGEFGMGGGFRMRDGAGRRGMLPPQGMVFGGPGGFPGGGLAGERGFGMGGASGGLLNGSRPSAALTSLLTEDGDYYTWVAATIGSNSASGYQLATQLPVMPIGGFNGSDPSPTLAQFKKYVAEKKIHYFIGGGGFRGGMGGNSDITSWVEANFTSTTVDGVTVYDLTSPKA
ncbi:MAG: glycosyltransferase family 39 protein [Nocardiaceae bacterium]|nr:glycosyltransferase family 39 protein [Nocardiaceae bacterium]